MWFLSRFLYVLQFFFPGLGRALAAYEAAEKRTLKKKIATIIARRSGKKWSILAPNSVSKTNENK